MRTSLVLGLSLLAGCVGDFGVPAPYDATLQPMDDIELAWSEAVNDYGDGYGTLALLVYQVVDAEGYPMDNIQVEVLTGAPGIYLLPEAAIQRVDSPDDEGVDCEFGSESYDPDICPWYDAANAYYFELVHSYEGDYAPNYYVGATDERGVLRIWAYVDAMSATSEGEFADATVWANIGVDSEVVTFTTAL